MALTKVAPAGIGSTPGDGYRIGSSFLHSTGVEITNINATGILTAASLDISGAIDFDGLTNLDDVNVAAAATFAGAIDANGDLDVDGHTNLDNVSIAGVTTFAGAIDANGDLDVDGHTNLDNVSIAGVSTFSGTVNTASIVATGIDLNGDIDVDGHTNLDNVSIAGVSTFTGNADFSSGVDVTGTITGNNLTLSDNDPELTFTDLNNNPDYRIKAESGNLSFEDTTNGNVARLRINADGHVDVTGNLDVGAGIDVTGNITGTGDLTLTDTTADSAAGPEFKLFRNSASPADADYLGQIKFAGESDTGVERNYAKITGKILDASNGTEDGILEFAHIKAGSQTITGRWRSDSLQLLNGTSLTVAGSTTVTGIIETTGSEIKITGAEPRLTFTDTDNNPDFQIWANAQKFSIYDSTNSATRLHINSDGDVGLGGVTSPTAKLHVEDNAFYLGRFKRTNGAGSLLLEGDGATEAFYLTLKTNNTTANSGCVIEGSDADGNGTSWIKLFTENHSTNAGGISLHTRPGGGSTTERFRITSGGDVTTTGAASFDRQNAGFTARAGDAVSITRASGTPLEINRTGSDGQMIGLLDDNSYEAAIGLDGGKLVFGLPNTSSPRLTIKADGKVGINASPTQMFEVHTDFGLADNTYYVGTSYRSGNNASGYTASGLHITSSADNNNGEKHTAFLGFSNRDPALNGSHGSNAYIAMSTPDSQGTYGTGQLDFYIRGSAAYAFPNDPQASSSYWMDSLFRIESNGRVKVPGELRVDRIVPDGGLPSGSFGGIIQIRWSANVDNANYSSSSDVTMQTVNITPQRSSSRMLIHVVYPSIRSYTTGNTRNRLNQHIKRDGSEIYNLNEMPQWRGANFNSSGVEINHNVAFTHIDHPNTTSQVTYTATWQSVDGHVWNTASGQMVMIVAELTG